MKLRVLIADDEQLERRALQSILSGLAGHEVDLLEATNGRQAVLLAETEPVDLAFLDIRMPGMDGLEAAAELRRLCPEIHIVFVTAFDHFDYAREAIRLGVDEYLVKPASAEEILHTAGRVMARIEEKRRRSAEGLRSYKDSGRALALLEEELRADLGKAEMDSRRLSSFFNLKGLSHCESLCIVLRLYADAKTDVTSRKLALARLKESCERHFSASGWYCLMEAGASELCCAVAIPDQVPVPGTGGASATRIVLQQLVHEILPGLGLRAFLGASYLSEAEGVAPFVAARDALALARPGTPLVLLFPGIANADGLGINRHGSGTVERALEYMHAHLAENLSLVDVASAVGSAPSHLSRLFSQQGGDTFVHVFCRLRISAAKDLLRTGQYRVKEVCSMVGFNDQAYFSRVFRKYEGVSPADYRAG